MAKTRTVELIAKLKDNMSPGLQKLTIGTIAAATAIIALGKKAIDASKELADYGAEIYDVATATGVAAQEIQAMGYVFSQTGGNATSFQGALRGINTFMRLAAQGGGEQIGVLSQLGMTYADLQGMEPGDIFLTLAEAIGTVDDTMERNIVSATIFGQRYSQQVNAVIEQTGGNIRELSEEFINSGRAMDEGQIDKLKEYSNNLTDFDFATKKLTADMLEDFLPMFTDMMNIFITGSGVAKDVADSFGGIGEVVKSLTILIGTFTIVKIADMAINGQLTLSTGILAAAKVKLAAATMTAKAALAGPAGLAAAVAFTGYKLVQLTKAMNDANESMQANEEATARAAEGNALVGDVMLATMTAVADGAELSAEQVEILTNQINNMGASEEVTADATRLLRAQLDGSIESMTFASNASENLTGKTEGLSLAMLDEAIAALEAESAMKQLHAELANGPTVIAGELARTISEAERLRQMMLDIKAGHDPNEGRDFGGGGLSPMTPEIEEAFDQYRTAFASLMADTSKMAGITDNEMAQNFSENMADRTEQWQEYYAGLDASEQARLQSIDEAKRGIADFATGMVMAAQQGDDAWGQFWDNFQGRLLSIVVSSAFQTLLGVMSGGVGGFFSSIFGFKGGGSVPHSPYQAAGGMTVPGSLTSNGDKTPIMAEAGEVVLSRNQAQDLKGGGSVTNVAIDYRPAFSSASAADVSRMVPLIKKAMEKGNL